MVDVDNDGSNPPLMDTYKHLFAGDGGQLVDDVDRHECDLPVIDLAPLLAQKQGGSEYSSSSEKEEVCRARARADMVRAASELGFFQVTNHGVPAPLLDRLREEQVRAFRRPFASKVRDPLLGFSPPESYRWGAPTATCLQQLSWSEAYHIPMTMTITPPSSSPADHLPCADADVEFETGRVVIEEVSTAMSLLAQQLASILVAELHHDNDDDEDDRSTSSETETTTTGCTRSTCFLRLNRYPPCPRSSTGNSNGGGAFGLCPHTDSDFLTILWQADDVGGLQLLNSAGRWLGVKPDPGALIVNVGDLLQAWSDDAYRSVEHRVVVASATRERFSVAFFLCPSDDTVIIPRPRLPGAAGTGSKYRSFTFGEYRRQVREDVSLTGRKVGLQRFRRPT